MDSRPAASLQIHAGDMFAGKYRVERVLGRGGMSVVFSAWHAGLGQRVALKLLATPAEIAAESVGRFFREARAAAALRSEYSARVVDVDVDELGRHYIVMEHLEGLDLGDVYRNEQALPVETCVGYVLHACEAMAEAHALGIIHRDLKPENLFLTRGVDGTPLVKVLDFGVSKLLNPSIHAADAGTSAANTVLGTPNYMSPDQIRTPQSVDGRTDIWSLGVILFELLTRRFPFRGDTVPDVLAAVLTSEPPSPTALRLAIPPELSAVVLRCLRKDVNQRWPNVGSLARALRPWAPPWALEAAHRAARISGIMESSSPSSPASSAPAAPRAPSSRVDPPSSASAAPERRVGAAAARRWPLLPAAAALLTALFLSALVAAPGASSSGAAGQQPGQQPRSAALEPAPAAPAPRAEPAPEQPPSLLAALDATPPEVRRRSPDTASPDREAVPSATTHRAALASPEQRASAAPARSSAPVAPPVERRRKPTPASARLDPLSSRR